MDWFHCNVCYARPETDQDATSFSASNCGHVFCNSCVQRLEDNVCPKCGEECRLVCIDQNIPKSIAIFFRSLNSTLKKLLSLSKEVVETLEAYQRGKTFQDSQRDHLMTYLLKAAQRPPSPPGIRITNEQAQQIKDKQSNDAQLIEKLQQDIYSLKALINSANQPRQQVPQVRSATAMSMNRSMMMPSPTHLAAHQMSPAFGQPTRPEQPSASRIIQSRVSHYKAPPGQVAQTSMTSARQVNVSAGPPGFMPASRLPSRTPAPPPPSRLSGPPAGGRSMGGSAYSAGRSGIIQQPAGNGRMSVASSHSDVSMVTVSTARTAGSCTGYQQSNGGGSSSSSRVVEGPTFNSRDQLYVKQRRV